MTAGVYSAKNPYWAQVREVQELNGAGSAKDTRHLVITLGADGPVYEPGDSLGVLPANDPQLVAGILEWLGNDGSELVDLPKGSGQLSVAQALQRLEITRVPKALLQPLAQHATDDTLKEVSDPSQKELITAFCDGRDLLDVLSMATPGSLSAQQLVDGMRPTLPRLYSIASSPRAHAGEVHLTVGVVTWQAHGRLRQGVASSYLGLRCPPQSRVPVFVHHAKRFKLPKDPSTDIIMVGPGTGIAPFRAFLQERIQQRAEGRHWLFFGDQHAATDFLYHQEFAAMQKDGHLQRLDVAFSRDQAYKVYVQDRMRERGAELWRWLDNGAVFYVCGDALRMAKDVDAALHQLIQEHGGMDQTAAAAYVKQMKKELRYLRDVYAI